MRAYENTDLMYFTHHCVPNTKNGAWHTGAAMKEVEEE